MERSIIVIQSDGHLGPLDQDCSRKTGFKVSESWSHHISDLRLHQGPLCYISLWRVRCQCANCEPGCSCAVHDCRIKKMRIIGWDVASLSIGGLRESGHPPVRLWCDRTEGINFVACSNHLWYFFRSDKEEQDAEVEPSVLGLQSHWDSTYADELVNFHEQGDNGEIWLVVHQYPGKCRML